MKFKKAKKSSLIFVIYFVMEISEKRNVPWQFNVISGGLVGIQGKFMVIFYNLVQ